MDRSIDADPSSAPGTPRLPNAIWFSRRYAPLVNPIYAYICMYVYIHTHTHIYIYTHTHKYIIKYIVSPVFCSRYAPLATPYGLKALVNSETLIEEERLLLLCSSAALNTYRYLHIHMMKCHMVLA